MLIKEDKTNNTLKNPLVNGYWLRDEIGRAETSKLLLNSALQYPFVLCFPSLLTEKQHLLVTIP